MRELGSEVAGGGKQSQQTQPKTKNPIVRTGRLVLSEQQSGWSVEEIETFLIWLRKHQCKNRETSSCVPCLLNALEQDKDADENVDADHVRAGRPLKVNNPSICSHSART